MKGSEIRHLFLEYFREKGHEVVPSSSLVPRSDPSLLFTNAGMVQFKGVFLGQEKRDYARAATCQKCMRAGGKHSDLENVGHTSRHHTFFEMLGNFSFGDYFKREAIALAWELLTGRCGLPAEKLWVTVFEEDDEAEALWQEEVGVPRERIVRLGVKDNFWQMADTGPCGPCSEILIDQGEEMGCGKPDCRVGCECDRYLELWNLVFMQYERDERGNLSALPNPSIDTGMGLERLSAVLQGKGNNFDTDLFAGIIQSISAQTGVPYGSGAGTDVSIRVMADHARAAAFLLGDGLMPANEGRGYVLRRIIRRASRHARLLGAEGPVLFKVLEAVGEAMGETYPELLEDMERAKKILEMEEQRFGRTLEQGMRILEDLIGKVKASGERLIPGGEVFRLYDTFGFPLDLARDVALDEGLQVDEAGFHEAMEAQRERARASWVGEERAIAPIYREVREEAGPTEFLGYERTEADALVKVVIQDGKVVEEVAQGGEAEVILDRTPFYGEAGGQVGDTGTLEAEGVVLAVLNTEKPLEDLPVHLVRVKRGTLRVWAKVRARVDEERRRAVMRNHTATHLLQAALRSVLGEHVKQAGSLVEPDRLRFDFTHFTALSGEDMASVETLVNEMVMENVPLQTEVSTVEEAVKAGALALFGEKYGETVRVVSVPGVSRELCGGTHVRATGDIGLFVLRSEGSVSSGIRRIEALTGRGALAHMKHEEEELRSIGAMLKAPEHPAAKVRELVEQLRELERERDRLKGAAMRKGSGDVLAGARTVGGVKVVAQKLEGLSPKDLRSFADHVRDRLGSGVVVLASVVDSQASLLAMVSKDLTDRLSAGRILKAVAEASGGRGGGKADLAQGGTRQTEKLDTALQTVYDIVEKEQGS
ncbi:MAG: alanine--tRNA ligase [Nitrospirota bacterium]